MFATQGEKNYVVLSIKTSIDTCINMSQYLQVERSNKIGILTLRILMLIALICTHKKVAQGLTYVFTIFLSIKVTLQCTTVCEMHRHFYI